MSEEFANQSESVVSESPVTTETTSETSSQTSETPVTTQEEYDTIKYNKEEIKIPVSERQTYLQKGYNYDKVQTQLEETKAQAAHLEYLAELNGYADVKEYIQAISEHKSQQQIRAEAAKMGVDENVFMKFNERLKPMETELEQLRSEREQFQKQEQSRQVKAELDRVIAANPDFDQYFPQIEQLFNKGYSIEDAYRLASYEDKITKIGTEKEQEVLARVTGRDQKQVLSSNDKPNNLAFSPANMSTADIMDISRRVQAGEKIKF
jgi:hypothetical protein